MYPDPRNFGAEGEGARVVDGISHDNFYVNNMVTHTSQT